MSRTRNHGCGRSKCSVCKPHKVCKRKGAKNAQYAQPAVRRKLQRGKEER